MAISIGQLGKHGRALGTGKRKRGSRRGVGGGGVSGTGGGGGDGGGRCTAAVSILKSNTHREKIQHQQ